VLGAVDHVGYLVRDLDAAVEEFGERFGLAVVRPVVLPQFSILGQYLGQGSGSVELFTITDEQLLAQRLGDRPILLDHAAYEVSDIDAVAAAMHRTGSASPVPTAARRSPSRSSWAAFATCGPTPRPTAGSRCSCCSAEAPAPLVIKRS
jgi:catechol 2,3-dioxygenase-like lactoylglutathione lyase family enzyme